MAKADWGIIVCLIALVVLLGTIIVLALLPPPATIDLSSVAGSIVGKPGADGKDGKDGKNGLNGDVGLTGPAALTATSVQPNSASGAGGTVVQLFGVGFTEDMKVRFAGALSPLVDFIDPNTANATVPVKPDSVLGSGSVAVALEVSIGTQKSKIHFFYEI